MGAGRDGDVSPDAGDLVGAQQACAGVVAPNALGYPIQIVLGGDRYGADWQDEIGRHLDAGIPPEMINLGIG